MEKDINSSVLELHVTGMHCNNCALSIHKMLEKKGAKDVFVSFASEEVRCVLDTQDHDEIKKEIENLGFKVVDPEQTQNHPFYDSIEFKFYFSLLFSLPLLLHMFVSWHFLHNSWVQLFLSLPVFVLGFVHFGKSGLYSIKSGIPNMDVLIFVGSSAAFIYSVIGMGLNLGNDYLFFETSATIIALVFLGNLLEKKSVAQTTSAIQGLISYQKTIAKRLKDGTIEEIASDKLEIGDTLVVNHGDKVPTDGEILSGEANLDESMLTGESSPVHKKKYDTVVGGTIVTEGNITMMVSKIGSNTVLAQIIDLMKKAQASKPSIQKIGDKVAAWFVPVVLLISVLTFLLSVFVFGIALQKAMMSAIAVLVISCPCAMGLATPTAVMVGLGRLARKGILVKGGDTIEEIQAARYVIFDKTGTLTNGEFKINDIQTVDAFSVDEAKSVILSIEERSNHPIAKSVVKELLSQKIQRIVLKSVFEEKGQGMKAEDVESNHWILGSAKMLGIESKDENHSLFLSKNGTVVAKVEISDQIRPEAKQMVSDLKSKGLVPVLLSGDNKRKCLLVAQSLEIKEWYFEQSPSQKLEVINAFKKKGNVIMVGDGINDAPALSYANVGVSLSSASQIAIQSSQVVLLKSNLKAIIDTIDITKHTILTIKQNLFWAFAYNAVAIPIAAMGYLDPMIGALSMAFSDVIVIGNAIRLKYKTIE